MESPATYRRSGFFSVIVRGHRDFLVFLTSASVWCSSSPRPSADGDRRAEVVGADEAAQPGHRREQRQLEAAQRAVGARLDVLLDVARVEQPGEEEAEQHGEEHRAGREAAPARPLVPLGQRADGLLPVRRLRLEPLLPLLGGLVAVRRLVARAAGAGGVLGRAPVLPRAARLARRALRALRARTAGRGRRAPRVRGRPRRSPAAPLSPGPAPNSRTCQSPGTGVGRPPRLVAARRPQVVPDEEVVVRAGPAARLRPAGPRRVRPAPSSNGSPSWPGYSPSYGLSSLIASVRPLLRVALRT